MNIIRGEDLLEEVGVADLILFAGHSYFHKETGQYNMDSPMLKRVAEDFDQLDRHFAQILHNRRKHRKEFYYLTTREIVTPYKSEGITFGIFQNRKKPGDITSVDILKTSVAHLKFWADNWTRIALEYPDNGLLLEEDILDVLDKLPSNIWVYIPELEHSVQREGEGSLPRGTPPDIHRR